ncbi:MAG TPA: VWA domain-containing protein [bacterium]|nr:VWA domain-containing protein [bacterium]
MPTFIWPALFWMLLLLPLLVALYVRLLRRPARYPVTYSTASVLADAVTRTAWRRHLAAAVFLLGLGAVMLAMMRPVLSLPIPADRAAIMLVLDVSGSMRSQDIEPSRLEAAKSAAKTFLDAVPDRIRIGLAVFAGFSSLLSPPTTDHGRVAELITGLGTARRTAIGEGLLEGVAGLPGRARPTLEGVLPPLTEPLPPGVVLLLSDGRNNAGIDPLEAAEIARRQQVKVYTVGLGDPMTRDFGWTIGGPMDEETLLAIASVTGGTYHHASSANALHNIYRDLARQIGWERRPTEVSAVAAAGAALLMIAAAVLSLAISQPLRA